MTHQSNHQFNHNTVSELMHYGSAAITGCNLLSSSDSDNGSRPTGKKIRRRRRTVQSIMYELGDKARMYYHMSKKSFWILHNKINCQFNNIK